MELEDWRFARGPSWGSRALIGRRAKGDKRHHVSSSYHHVYRTFSFAYFDLSVVMAGNRQRTLGTTRMLDMLLSSLTRPNVRLILTHALVRSGTATTPGTFLRCARDAAWVFVWLVDLAGNSHHVLPSAEAVSGELIASGSTVRCTK